MRALSAIFSHPVVVDEPTTALPSLKVRLGEQVALHVVMPSGIVREQKSSSLPGDKLRVVVQAVEVPPTFQSTATLQVDDD